MKKLPLALSALAISTVSVAGVGELTWATAGTSAPVNQGALDGSNLVTFTKINPRGNSISFILNRYDESMGQNFFEIEGLGAIEDQTVERETAMDQYFLVDRTIGYYDDKIANVGLNNLSDFVGLTQGVEYELKKHPAWMLLTKNTSGVMYYIVKEGTNNPLETGKIDYSMCIDSDLYREAEAAAGDEDVLECRAEANRAGEGFYYVPYLNGEQLVERATPEPELEPEPEPEPILEPVVQNTETGVEDTIVTEVGQGSADTAAASDVRYVYATVTSEEGSAYQNSENTGVTEEYAADTDVWAVDESKVWEDGSGTEAVETPELGEEDCGHFWLLVIGWTLAVAGWGIMGARWLVKRK